MICDICHDTFHQQCWTHCFGNSAICEGCDQFITDSESDFVPDDDEKSSVGNISSGDESTQSAMETDRLIDAQEDENLNRQQVSGRRRTRSEFNEHNFTNTDVEPPAVRRRLF